MNRLVAAIAALTVVVAIATVGIYGSLARSETALYDLVVEIRRTGHLVDQLVEVEHRAEQICTDADRGALMRSMQRSLDQIGVRLRTVFDGL